MNGRHSSQRGNSNSNGDTWGYSDNHDTELDEPQYLKFSKNVNQSPYRHTNGGRRNMDTVLQSAKPPPEENDDTNVSVNSRLTQNGSNRYNGHHGYRNGRFETEIQNEGRNNGYFSHGQRSETGPRHSPEHTIEPMYLSENNEVHPERFGRGETALGKGNLQQVLREDQSKELESYKSQNKQNKPRSGPPLIPTFESLFRTTTSEQRKPDKDNHERMNNTSERARKNPYHETSEELNYDISPLELRSEDPFRGFNRDTTPNRIAPQSTYKRSQWNQPQLKPETNRSNDNIQRKPETRDQPPSQSTNEHRQKPFMVNSQSAAKDLVNLSEFVEVRGEPTGMYGSANPWARRMYTKENRLSTFVRWPKEDIVSVESLAEFGWYFTGPDDRVECPHCCGAVYNWVAGDTALGEHKRHFPNCPFIKDKLRSMLEHVSVETPFAPIISLEEPQTSEPSVGTAIEIVKELGYSDEQIDSALDYLSRKDKIISSQNILDAIFSYQAHRDMQVTPERETAPIGRNNDVSFNPYNSPRDHVIQHQTPQAPPRMESATIGDKSEAASTEEVVLTKKEKEESTVKVVEQLKEEQKELSTLSAEYEDLQAKVTCKICLDAKIESLFLPCRHLVCCEDCANMVRECPFCRARIEGVVKVFL